MREKIINDYKNSSVAKELYKKYDTCLYSFYNKLMFTQ